MEFSLENSQVSSVQKVKNILIRQSCSKEVKKNSNYQHPETSYILKYSPKYYKSVTLETTPSGPLLSKVRKIKKLKRFTGLFKTHLPQKLWFNVLANNRKEIEEIPQIYSIKKIIKPSESSRNRLEQEKITFFPNMRRVLLSEWKVSSQEGDCDNLLSIKELFVKYAWSMRKLKGLKIRIFGKQEIYDKAKWILEKLDKMSRFLDRLDTFIFEIKGESVKIQDLFHKKNVLSRLTGLHLYVRFDSIFAEIPQRCKNLNFLSLDFPKGICEKPAEFLTLVTSIHDLSQLQSLQLTWPKDAISCWSHFKPIPSLRHLKLEFDASNLIKELGEKIENEEKVETKNVIHSLFGKAQRKKRIPVKPKPDVVGHWEDINELEVLEFKVSFGSEESLDFMRNFITMILKKVRRVRSLKLWMACQEISSHQKCFLFSVEEVSHLYESLERLDYRLSMVEDSAYSVFDLNIIKPFRNLRELNFGGGGLVFSENIEDLVGLLQANQYPELKINVREDSLRKALEKIEKVKRINSNLKMKVGLTGHPKSPKDFIETLERVCNEIQSIKEIKGLVFYLSMMSFNSSADVPIECLKEILEKYLSIRNFVVQITTFEGYMEYRNIDGEKRQLFIDMY